MSNLRISGHPPVIRGYRLVRTHQTASDMRSEAEEAQKVKCKRQVKFSVRDTRGFGWWGSWWW